MPEEGSVRPASHIHPAIETSRRLLVRGDEAFDEGTPATLALMRGEIPWVQLGGRPIVVARRSGLTWGGENASGPNSVARVPMLCHSTCERLCGRDAAGGVTHGFRLRKW
jgi:hypothetical protein